MTPRQFFWACFLLSIAAVGTVAFSALFGPVRYSIDDSLRSAFRIPTIEAPNIFEGLGTTDIEFSDPFGSEFEPRQAGVSFHVPGVMIADESYHVTALLRTVLENETQAEFRERLLAELAENTLEIVEQDDVSIKFLIAGELMQATLDGRGFTISESDFEVQRLTLAQEAAGAIWDWKVQPEDEGWGTLLLRIARFDDVSGEAVPVVVASIRREIRILPPQEPAKPVASQSESRQLINSSIYNTVRPGMVQGCEWMGADPDRTNRFALVIGNSNYGAGISDLTYTRDDAAVIATALSEKGFSIFRCFEASVAGLNQIMESFSIVAKSHLAGAAAADSAVLFYYSGHGMAAASTGSAVIIPVDLDVDTLSNINRTLSEEQPLNIISLEEVTVRLGALGASNLVVFFDACRNKLDEDFRDFEGPEDYQSKGLTRTLWRAQNNQYMAYANRWGETTPDSGLYAATLAESILQEDISMLDVLNQVQDTVAIETSGTQFPEYVDYAIGDLTL